MPMDWAWAAEPGAGGGSGGGYWQLAIVLAAIGLLGLFARWRKARAPAMPTTSELRERDENPNRYRDAADRAIVDLLETSQTLNAQVDTKIRVLNRLVKEAEEHAARLEALLAEARRLEEGIPAQPGAGTPAPQAAAAEPAPETRAKGFLSELHERIYRLRADGKSVAEIARATSLSTTEVEFIVRYLDQEQG